MTTSNQYTTVETPDGKFTRICHHTGNIYEWTKREKPLRTVPKARNGVTLPMITSLGNKIRIKHFRYAKYTKMRDNNVVVIPSSFRHDPNYAISHKGGYTHITIKTPSGKYICVSSVCNVEDSFNYKEGICRALERLTPYDLVDMGLTE